MDALCRLCGSEDGVKVSIFEPGTEHVKKIHKILPITVNEHDPLPKTMCHRCSFKVNDFFEFRTNCIKAQEEFKSKVPWLRDKHATNINIRIPPMVEVPLNSVYAVSPIEKRIPKEPAFIDENDSMITIEDDSSHSEERNETSSSLLNDCPQEKLIMKIKKSSLKKKPAKKKCVWDTKKRKKKSRKSCKITEVFSTKVDEFQNISNIENDPLHIAPVESNEGDAAELSQSTNTNHKSFEKEIPRDDKTAELLRLNTRILITNIPRIGNVYTCEECGRTFLTPHPASLHACDEVRKNVEKSQDNEQVVSSAPVEFYNCTECGQGFTRQSQLISHSRKHCEADSSSGDDFMPFNYRKRHHRKKKPKSETPKQFSISFDEREHDITRHSLLSSDSE